MASHINATWKHRSVDSFYSHFDCVFFLALNVNNFITFGGLAQINIYHITMGSFLKTSHDLFNITRYNDVTLKVVTMIFDKREMSVFCEVVVN